MLWYKAWLDTRLRFLIGLGLLAGLAVFFVFAYSSTQELMLGIKDTKGSLADTISEIAHLSGSFRGYIWVQFVRQNLTQPWTIFAVLLGAEGLISKRRGGLFTLALPVSRTRLCAVRAAMELAELLLLSLIPMLLVVLLAPAAGHNYMLTDALVYGISIFVGGALFYCLALLLATAFGNRWLPIVITLAVAAIINPYTDLGPALARLGPVSVMTAESYFRTGVPAWAGLFTWAAISAALFYTALRSINGRDF